MRPYGKLGIAVLILTLIPLAASMSLTNGPSASIGTSDAVSGVYSTTNAQIFAMGSIQSAVDAAKSGDTIFLWPKTYYENVLVPKSLNIVGSGALWTIVDGSKPTDPNFGSVFAIGMDKQGKYVPGVTATLDGLTIRKGTGTLIPNMNMRYGGGIFNDKSTLTVKNCIISDNTADLCGGVANVADVGGTATMTMMNNQIFGNTATTAGAGGVGNLGADIGSTATMTLINNNIFWNTAHVVGAGVGNAADVGGAATMTLRNNNIFRNTAKYDGGGISNTVYYGTATLNVINSQIFGNTAGNGGGIYNLVSASGTAIVNLQSGSIDHNVATKPSPSGGGIYNDHGTINGNQGIVHDNTPDQVVNA